MPFRAALSLSFLLGAGLMFAFLRLLPLVPIGAAGDVEDLSLVIPAVTSETYRYRQAQGFLAVLKSANGRNVEMPAAWLPGGGEVRGEFRVGTTIELEADTSKFTTVVEKLE